MVPGCGRKRDGLAAPEPAHGFPAEVLARRGYGEERMIAPLWQRLEQEESPAQRARWFFAEEGVEGLIEFSDVESYLRER
ncbi:MAG: hypothetical protein OXC27_18020 [Caldilineaceae bacterium]|nr:hypothetical protein [Caldilineaceae bacterium]